MSSATSESSLRVSPRTTEAMREPMSRTSSLLKQSGFVLMLMIILKLKYYFNYLILYILILENSIGTLIIIIIMVIFKCYFSGALS